MDRYTGSSVTTIKMTVKVDFAVTVFLILHVPMSPLYEEELWYIVNPWSSDFHHLNPTLLTYLLHGAESFLRS